MRFESFCKRLQKWKAAMTKIGIGIVGGGYMGKAHSVAMSAVGAVFDTALRPSLEVICTTTAEGCRQQGPAVRLCALHRRLAHAGG